MGHSLSYALALVHGNRSEKPHTRANCGRRGVDAVVIKPCNAAYEVTVRFTAAVTACVLHLAASGATPLTLQRRPEHRIDEAAG